MKSVQKTILMVALAALALPGAARAADNWQTFRSEAGGFEILMPGVPAEEQEDVDGAALHQFKTESEDGRVFAVAYLDAEAELDAAAAAEAFSALRDGFLEGAGLTLQSERELEVAGHAARELLAQGPEGALLKVRLIVTGKRVFMLVAGPAAEGAGPEEIDRFLDSFWLL